MQDSQLSLTLVMIWSRAAIEPLNSCHVPGLGAGLLVFSLQPHIFMDFCLAKEEATEGAFPRKVTIRRTQIFMNTPHRGGNLRICWLSGDQVLQCILLDSELTKICKGYIVWRYFLVAFS